MFFSIRTCLNFRALNILILFILWIILLIGHIFQTLIEHLLQSFFFSLSFLPKSIVNIHMQTFLSIGKCKHFACNIFQLVAGIFCWQFKLENQKKKKKKKGGLTEGLVEAWSQNRISPRAHDAAATLQWVVVVVYMQPSKTLLIYMKPFY